MPGLPSAIDSLLLARQGKRFSGKLALKDLPRLAALSSEPSSGWIEVDLQFSHDEGQKYWVQGSIRARFDTICQRCLEQMSLSLHSEVHILLVGNNANDHVTVDQGKDIIVCKGNMPIAELIEDDLLLVMPMFPKHQANSCQARYNPADITLKSTKTTKQQKQDLRTNPFAVLATLKSDKKSGKKKD